MPAAARDANAEAMQARETWLATGLVRARAMLQLTHPEQAAFLVRGIEGGKGAEAILNIGTFLKSCRAPEKDASRKQTRKADREALAIIERSGTTKMMRREL